MNLCFFFLLSNVLPKVSRMKNSYCGNPTKFFLVIVMKKGPKTKWMTAIEQRQIPNIIFFTIQHNLFFSGLPETLCDIILAV